MSYDSSIATYLSPQARGIPCRDLKARAPEIANYMGYHSGGIQKYSMAAEGMRREARTCGGGVPSMANGGVSASLQSIEATGMVKVDAERSLSDALTGLGMKTVDGSSNRIRLLN
eukprot:gene24842-10496_t